MATQASTITKVDQGSGPSTHNMPPNIYHFSVHVCTRKFTPRPVLFESIEHNRSRGRFNKSKPSHSGVKLKKHVIVFNP